MVTPSYNQAQFLEETIRSVLLQGYPNLEYIIIDGGSSDFSVNIITKYGPWLTSWVSEADRGQSHAINKGWRRVTGQIVAYLNSDDTYLPGALMRVAQAWVADPHWAVAVGGILSVDENSKPRCLADPPRLPFGTPTDLTLIDHDLWFLPQASSFYSRPYLGTADSWLQEDLHYAMDRELLYRLCRLGRVVLLPHLLATYRIHNGSKTQNALLAIHRETKAAFRYHRPASWTLRLRQRRVLRWRIASGYCRGGRQSSGHRALWLLFRAAMLRPGYLGRPSFLRSILTATPGLRAALQMRARRRVWARTACQR